MKSLKLGVLLSGWLVAALCISTTFAQNQPAAGQQQPAPKTVQEKASYGIGTSIGRNLKQQNLEVSLKFLLRGITDAVMGKEPVVSEADLSTAMQQFEREMTARRQAKMKEEAEANKAVGQKFLVDNAKKPGVVVRPSGLQYKVVKKGDGPSPKPTSRVKAHYHGTLIDGSVFDSSVQRGEPLEIGVNQVIPGWTEALQAMKVGDKWILYVPSDLAYGPRSPGPGIGPNSTLIFEIELLEILN